MILDSLVLDPEDAAERLDEYSKMVADERTAEDDAIAAGYRAAKRGLPVISLKAAFAAAGRFDAKDRQGNVVPGLPRLAIVRADATSVRVSRSTHGGWLFDCSPSRWGVDRGALVGKDTVRVPITEDIHWMASTGVTVVPTIPPRHRPNRRRLHRFHILWEVEKWTPEPPVDPALLRHIRGDLWAVQAVWDLTELERAVLAQRAQS